MAGPISVVARRGGTSESRHRVHAVAVRDGEVVASAGEPELVTFFRSSAKPFQALPLVRARPDLADEEVAIASASHLARPEQLAAVRSLLARAEATEDDLACGPGGHPPSRLNHNCSGKHAGMLVLCRARGWPLEGYRLPDHPLQQALLHELAGAAGVAATSLPTATDGCGVVTYALSLARMAGLFAGLARLPGGSRVAAALRARPELVRGPGDTETELMRLLPGWVAKGGAEGLLCAAGPDGTGIAVKAEDGNSRALGPAVGTFLEGLGLRASGLARAPLWNSLGEEVGDLVTES